MKKTIYALLQRLILLIAIALPSNAQAATVLWDQNPETEVVGYNIYYQSGTSTFPFNGTTIPEGTSPIFIDGSARTSLELNIPDDGMVYYFTATAIADNGVESDYSEIIASSWIPYLLAPVENESINSTAFFSWDLPPAGYNLTYDLYYGTDPQLSQNATAGLATTPPNPHNNTVMISLIVLLLGLTVPRGLSQVKGFLRPIRITVCIGLFALQASCGGGGSGSSAGTPPTPNTPVFTHIVTNLSETQYQVTDLQPGTRYYWKIVAVDNFGKSYESLIEEFVTNNI